LSEVRNQRLSAACTWIESFSSTIR
jgi:hypothetical protein